MCKMQREIYWKNVKYFAEFVGTAVLITIGCGTAMIWGLSVGSAGYMLTALARFWLYGMFMLVPCQRLSSQPAVSVGVLWRGNVCRRLLRIYYSPGCGPPYRTAH